MIKLRVAVVGAGHLGRIHARLLAQRSDVLLVGIADPVAEAREQAAAECGAPVVADYAALFEHADAAIVATPTRTHHAATLDCLDHGLHVLVEKPLATSVREADELVAAARRRGAVLQVGHIERFNPALTAVRPHLADVQYLEAVRAGAFSARSTDIGAVLDLMIHDIDLALAVTGRRVRSVLAMGRALLGRHEDVAHARLEFENGCVAQLSASRVHFGTARRTLHAWTRTAMVDVDFAARSARVVNASPAVLRHELDVDTLSPPERIQLRDRLGQEHLVVENLAVEDRNAMVDQQNDFVECVRANRTPRASGDDGRDALVVAERVLAAIAVHERTGGNSGPPMPPHPIIRGPHWQAAPDPRRRRAG